MFSRRSDYCADETISVKGIDLSQQSNILPGTLCSTINICLITNAVALFASGMWWVHFLPVLLHFRQVFVVRLHFWVFSCIFVFFFVCFFAFGKCHIGLDIFNFILTQNACLLHFLLFFCSNLFHFHTFNFCIFVTSSCYCLVAFLVSFFQHVLFCCFTNFCHVLSFFFHCFSTFPLFPLYHFTCICF